jgi:HD-like signal output (HDOD) protein
MTGSWMGFAAGAAGLAAGAWAFGRRRRAVPPRAPEALAAAPLAPPPTAAPAASTEVAEPHVRRELPAALLELRWETPRDLPGPVLEQHAKALRSIPRPPRALHQLLSHDFVWKASSSDLADLVRNEPLVAARVLARVHSPAYGRARTVTKIGQAITLLGMTAVRNICLRYLLDESFKSDDPRAARSFEALGEASTIGSELGQNLAQRLSRPDPAGVSTLVLLSFTGHLAAVLLQARQYPGEGLAQPDALLPRIRDQQQLLGLPAGELGRLLMQGWQLPPGLIAEVAWVDRLLVTPVDAAPPASAADFAIAYLSARLADRAVAGTLPEDPEALWQLLDTDPDFHHLHGYLALPVLRELPQLLATPGLLAGLQARRAPLAA